MKRITTVTAKDSLGEVEVVVALSGRSREALRFRHDRAVEDVVRSLARITGLGRQELRVVKGRART